MPGQANVHGFGMVPGRFACRVCDQKFSNKLSLIEHYDTHDDQTANLWDPFSHHLPSSALLQQSIHPYFPNGHGNLQQQAHETNPVANDMQQPAHERNPAQDLNLLQARNQFVARNNSSTDPPQNQIMIPGWTPAARTSQFDLNQPTQARQPDLHPLVATNYAPLPRPRSDPMPEPSLSIGGQQLCILEDQRTTWYLGLLEQPIPNTNDWAGDDGMQEYNLDLALELSVPGTYVQ